MEVVLLGLSNVNAKKKRKKHDALDPMTRWCSLFFSISMELHSSNFCLKVKQSTECVLQWLHEKIYKKRTKLRMFTQACQFIILCQKSEPPYSPDLTPCHFFSKFKSPLKVQNKFVKSIAERFEISFLGLLREQIPLNFEREKVP